MRGGAAIQSGSALVRRLASGTITDTYRKMTGPNNPEGINGELARNFAMLVCVSRFSGGSC
jgi:hypothetical protein